MVGLVRGGAGAVILSLLGVVIVQVGNLDAGDLAPYLPVAILALRTAEAWVLDQREPKVRRARPAKKAAAKKRVAKASPKP